MNLKEISILRLINQQIVGSNFKNPKDIVTWMGAMQAQDFNMAKWAVGIRLNNSTDKLIQSAIDKGEILRTHLLRPTWHFVSSEDIYWILQLTSQQIKNSMKSRDKILGLTDTIYKKSNTTIEKTLYGGKHLSRESLITELVKAGMAVDDNRASHLLMRAELDGIICSGKSKANKQTYALLSERVLKTKTLKRDEALAELAQRYFTSHCPATLQDFVWWSGLSVSDSKQALEMIKSKFVSETIDNQTYWFKHSFSFPKFEKDLIYFLPAFDEFIISYKNRSASLPYQNHIKTVSNNGIFRPIIVKNGQVIGIWKRIIKNDKVMLQTEYFNLPGSKVQNKVLQSFTSFAQFVNKEVKIIEGIDLNS